MKQILKLTLLLLALLLPATAVANPITLQQAQQNALSFLQEKGKSITISSLRHAQLRSGSTIPESYYVFNIGSNEGYVITAGDDCAPAILGYAESGYIDVDSIPDNLKGWLEEYAQQIQFMREKGYSPSKTPKLTSSYSAISPLLTTTWDQLDPYNQNCPDFFSYGKCVTGCVATAMAQVMYYHRARSVTQTTAQIPAYTCRHRWISGTDTLQIHVDAIPAGSPIDWDNMLNSYGSSATTTQEQAVANLMKYCGASVQMDYANEWNGGSGAYSTDVPTALKTYFNYSSETVLKNRSSYSTNDAWESLIYNELSNSRPVYYSGRNSSGGHAFVCDGYDGSGYYHINWGWSGTSDGYFLLTALDPNEQGTGGSSSGYNQSQAALIYAEPKSSSPSNPVLATSISLNKTSAELNTGETLQLTATVLPSNATNKTVTWSTSNSSVATVNSNGLVTAISPGTATITAMTTDGTNLSAYCSVTVKQNSQGNIISFADANVKALCVQNWDTDGDGELSTSEAAAVTSLGTVFKFNASITSFDELQYFTGLTSIVESAFYGCSGLTSITIPSGVTNIGNYAFRYCSGLTHITVDSDNTVYDSRNNCNAIIEKSNNQLLVGCKNTIIPSGVTSIGDRAFEDCDGLTSITIPSSVTSIGNNAFAGCSVLSPITIPSSVTSIGECAFSDCRGLESITIPSGVTSIGLGAFSYCSGLYDVYSYISNPSQITMGGKVFILYPESYPVRTLYVPAGSLAAYQEDQEWSEYFGSIVEMDPILATSIELNETSAELNTGETLQLAATVLPSNATNKTVTWSTSNSSVATVNSNGLVTAISTGTATITAMTTDGTNLSASCSITVKQNSQGNIISFADATVKALCVQNWDTNGDGELSEEEAATVTSLGTVFEYNENITSFNELQYFSGLTSIGDYAFYGCSGLTSVTIPNSVTRIGFNAFRRSGLKCVSIPNSVIYIEPGAFANCINIESIIVDNNNPHYDSRSNSNAIIESSTNKLISGCKNTIIPNTVKSIGYLAFIGCSGLSSINIPNSVDTIDIHAFSSCDGLTTIYIPNSVTIIGDYAFAYCSGLASITIPNSVTTIGNHAFAYCSGLASITIGNSVISIGAEAFEYCSGLTSITIPSGVTSIGQGAFSYCNGLNKVYSYISNPSLITMGGSVFYRNPQNYAVRTLYVPVGSLAVYQADQKWSEYFGSIVEMSILATSIELNETSAELNTGETLQLAATVLPSNATNKTVTWSTSNSSVATVNSNGLVTAISPGTATITAMTTDGSNLSASCLVTVTEDLNDYENYLSIDNIEAFHGDTIVIPVKMFNEASIISFQTDIFLPEGLELLQEDGEYVIDPSERMTRTHTIMSNDISSGAIRVICYSSNYKSFTGNSGDDLFYLTVKVADDAEGDYTVQMRNTLLTTSDFEEIAAPDVAANVNVKAYLLGDANNSGTVTITDVVVTSQYVLEMNPQPFVFEAADANFDGNITVTDVSRIAWMVLNPDEANAPMRASVIMDCSDHMSGEGITLATGETRTVSIALNNTMDYTACQLDLRLPEGLTASNFRLTDRAGSHAFDINTLANGKTRALCYSPAIEVIDGHDGALLTFDVTATAAIEGCITIDGIELVTADCQTVHPDAFTIGVNAATGINEIAGSKTVARVDYFNVAGQRIDRPDSGVILVVTTYTDGTRSTTKLIR